MPEPNRIVERLPSRRLRCLPPGWWWWHGSMAIRSWARFVQRWVDAEVEPRDEEEEEEEISSPAAGVESSEAAGEEARASVAATPSPHCSRPRHRTRRKTRRWLSHPGGAPPTPRQPQPRRRGRGRGGGQARATRRLRRTCCWRNSEPVTWTVLSGERVSRSGLLSGRVTQAIGSDSRRRRDAQIESGGRGGGAAAMGAAAEGLGLLCRGLGAAIAVDGPGAGAWRVELLRDGRSLAAAAVALRVVTPTTAAS